MTKIYFRQALNYTALCCCYPGHTSRYILINLIIKRPRTSRENLYSHKGRGQRNERPNSQATSEADEVGQSKMCN